MFRPRAVLMKRLGTILILIFAAIVLTWGGFIVGRSYREHSIKKCAKGFGECMQLLEDMEGRFNDCRLKLPRE